MAKASMDILLALSNLLTCFVSVEVCRGGDIGGGAKLQRIGLWPKGPWIGLVLPFRRRVV